MLVVVGGTKFGSMKSKAYKNLSLHRLLCVLEMTRPEFARLVGTSTSVVQGWITRRKKPLTESWALRIEAMTGASAEDLLKGTGTLRLSAQWKHALDRYGDDTYTRSDFDTLSHPPEPCRARLFLGAFSDVVVMVALVLFAAAKAEERSRVGKVKGVAQSLISLCRQQVEKYALGPHVVKIMASPDWWNQYDGLSTTISSKVQEVVFARGFYNRKVQALLPHSGFYNEIQQIAANDYLSYPGGWPSSDSNISGKPEVKKSTAAQRAEIQMQTSRHSMPSDRSEGKGKNNKSDRSNEVRRRP